MRELASNQPGYFNVVHTRIHGEDCWGLDFMCPCGCGDQTYIPLCIGQKEEHAWLFDGNQQAPTLSPSIRRLTACKFHGYLKDGVWSSAGDGAPLSPRVYRGGAHHPIEPRRELMSETPTTTPPAASDPPAAATEDPNAATQPAPTLALADTPPDGYALSSALLYIDGVLHQRWDAGHPGAVPASVWAPVPGVREKPAEAPPAG